MDNYLDEKFTKPPEQRDGQAQNTTVAEGTPPATETQTAAATAIAQANTGTAAVTTPTEVPDKFFDDFNKRFSTTFKGDEDVKAVLGLQQKIAEFEGKAKLSDELTQKVEGYKQQIEEIKDKGNSEFLSKPRIRQAYVAQQLIDKYPDKDADVLQQIVMADLSKLSDLQVLVKNQKIDLPTLSESDIEVALKDKYGIDPDAKPEEWSSISKTKLAIDAASARANIKTLTNGIELPKTVTKEEREQAIAQTMQQRAKTLEPFKAEFTAFDKFKKGDFEFDSTSDFKSRLGESFDNMFLKDGLEPTPENLQLAKEMRDAQFLYQNFDKMREVIVKQAQTEIQKKLDEALNNTKPPNTATATDEVKQAATLPGLSKFLEDNR